MGSDDLLKERCADTLCSLECSLEQIRDCINGTWAQHVILKNAATQLTAYSLRCVPASGSN